MEICHRCQQLKESFESIGFSSLRFGKKESHKFHICKECVEEMHKEMFGRATQKEEKKEIG